MIRIFISLFISIVPVFNQQSIANIEFILIEKGNSGHHYIWLHGDEQTAKMALEYHMKKNNGKAYFIKNELREVNFFGGLLDPNRIFSSIGAQKNIQKYNPNWTAIKKKESLAIIDKDRKIFLQTIFPKNEKLLIAVHNNYKGYNINRELAISDSVSVKKNQNLRDFYLCTNRNDFEILAMSPFNVVLQESPSSEDDGSLSWAALKSGVRYINIETRLGWLSVQKNMLSYIEENLP